MTAPDECPQCYGDGWVDAGDDLNERRCPCTPRKAPALPAIGCWCGGSGLCIACDGEDGAQ